MSQSVQATAVESLVEAPRAGLLPCAAAIVETTKPRITRLVTITAAVGFALGAIDRRWELGELLIAGLGVLAGTALSAAGANSLNQWLERERDARMPRTAGRPLPEGRLKPGAVVIAGSLLALVGVLTLWAACGPIAALVSLTTILLYLLCYTPLKPVTPLATVVGAVPGALPPVIGWAAARYTEGPEALLHVGPWALFAIMFVWQVPHFLAIAWMYKDDYAAGGYRVLPVVDPTGRRTARSIVAWSLLLVPATVAPALLMDAAPASLYALITLIMGLGFFGLSWRVVRSGRREDARKAFIASIIHLPLVLVAVVAFAVISRVLA
ncbi:MAG: heme o synthase [Phycisphaerales bacterium]